MKGANLILRYGTTWKGSASESTPVRLGGLAPSLAPAKALNAQSSLWTGCYQLCGISFDILDEDDRDHDYPDLVVPFVPTVATEHRYLS